MKTLYTCLLFSAVSCSLATAQQLVGYQSGNFAGTNGLYLNPSSITDSRWGAFLHLGTASVQATDQPLPWASIPFSKTKLKLRGDELGLTQADVRGPGAMLQFLSRHAVAVTTRYRADFRASGDTELVSWLRGRTRSVPQGPKTIGLQSDAYSEIAFSYAASVLDWQQHFLKVGATYKVLRGSQSIDLSSGGSWGTSADNLLPYNIAFVESTQSDLTYLSDYNFRKAVSGSAPGRGSGFDLGFTYEFRPKAEQYRYRMDGKTVSDPALTKYLLRVGVSLLDVGRVRYPDAARYRLTDAVGTIRQSDFQNLKSTEAVQIALLLQLRRPVDIVPQERTVDLPQTLVVNVDGQIGKGWFVGGTLVAPRQSSATGLHRSGVVSVGPRYESSGFEWGVSGNYWQAYRKVSLSAHVRLGIFSLGTDNLLGFFSDNGLNPHVFAGVAIPFLHKRPKDNDGDYVSNRRDLCPDVAGVWAFKGCPDTDNDGIQDKDDVCPNDAGPAETKGCPDADKDGIFDKNDACPNEAGSARFNGCPDSDNDGIANSEDECPTEAGPATMGGCPDKDNDGLKDSQDRCPQEAGLKELDGCALKALSVADVALSASENSLLTSVANVWQKGSLGDSATVNRLQTWLQANPKGTVALEFIGADQDQLLRVAALFRDVLTPTFGNRVTYTVKKREGQAAGLKVGLVK